MDLLQNYRALVAKVDSFCHSVENTYAQHISCNAGCDSCCRHLSLFPVEAHALAEAAAELPPAEAERLRQQVEAASPDRCPLLMAGLCLLYAHRPLICRTHGLPLLIKEGEATRVDCCPLNFTGLETLPGGAVLNLENVNAALVAINAVFVAAWGEKTPSERITIAEAILSAVPKKRKRF